MSKGPRPGSGRRSKRKRKDRTPDPLPVTERQVRPNPTKARPPQVQGLAITDAQRQEIKRLQAITGTHEPMPTRSGAARNLIHTLRATIRRSER